MTLQSIDFQAARGEFICIIGDVGAGKTSLLKSIVGDLVYISNDEIESQGGEQALLEEKKIDEWKKKLLNSEYMADSTERPITICGKLSFVEQNPWI